MSSIITSLRSSTLRIRPSMVSRVSSQPFQSQLRFNSNIKLSTDLKDFKELIKNENLSITDFYATWCGPCKAISPYLEKLSTEFTEVQFLKVDVDESQDIAQEYGITAMPTFVLFKNGEPIGKIVGANPPVIRQAIEQYQ
ncbi:Thioredoxin-3, mitochondrial [Wickerhamomyces ciferrii]|uniref:Thioredoxin-3, mitochondrial n=1 Tax=Wickerhamomyces ciferrii (strain ATCC 14091 / BCRC 22168 / CBS 111 / JCM 3599 / NBRC 0793 / NRRL Y-1031 F-60-10) TaxID=1206466 RepID=K0KMM9_WICCF|nr:Thioredoxin-3, mitochondrial [Wickerhamomyces ciferrii]CCH42368.1 Thioredoxin-3, mitochondrial [Wickerhamomyces ciferrii]